WLGPVWRDTLPGFLLWSRASPRLGATPLPGPGGEPVFVRDAGPALPQDVIDRIVPGTTTPADVLALCGPPDEDRVRRGAPGSSRSLVYRATRRIPRPRLAVGRLTTVARWDV